MARRRYTKTSLAALAVGAFTLALGAGAAIPRPAARRGWRGRNALFVLQTNALHTDLAIPATPFVRKRFAFLADVGIPITSPKLSHILIGWGGEGFYPNNGQPHRIGLPTLVASVIGDDSVLRFAPIADPGGKWASREPIEVTDHGLRRIVAFVEETLDRDAEGKLMPLDHPGISHLDHFYEARPVFAALCGCNTWVSQALAHGGIVTGRWTPFPQTLFASLRLHRERPTGEGNATMRMVRRALRG